MHAIYIAEPPHPAPVWTWNQSMEKPTFTPSIKVTGPIRNHNGTWVENGICHTYVTDGKIQYLDDCSHHLVGQTVELLQVPIPEGPLP